MIAAYFKVAAKPGVPVSREGDMKNIQGPAFGFGFGPWIFFWSPTLTRGGRAAWWTTPQSWLAIHTHSSSLCWIALPNSFGSPRTLTASPPLEPRSSASQGGGGEAPPRPPLGLTAFLSIQGLGSLAVKGSPQKRLGAGSPVQNRVHVHVITM